MAKITKVARELSDLEIKEVSLVDKAANKKKFLFFKAHGETDSGKSKTKKLKKKINIVMDTDGTIGGTKISVNKEELKDLQNFSMYFYNDGQDDSRAVSISYSKFVEADDGFSRSETFYLSKGDSGMKINEEIQKQLEAYYGDGVAIEIDNVSEVTDIVKALGTVNEYRGDFPDDLKTAVRLIAKQAAQFVPGVVAEDGVIVEKAGAKLSKDTLKKLSDAMATLKSLLPQLAEKSDKSDATDADDVAKALTDITKKLADLEGKEATDEATDLAKSLVEIGKRLESIEKQTPGRKSTEDSDGDGDGDEETIEKSGTKWPSFQV